MSTAPILTSQLLSGVPGVAHAFFTRQGGASSGVYASLNVGLGSGDDPAAVAENRRRAAAMFDAPPERLATCYQVHSARIVTAEGAWPAERPNADGIATRTSGIICGALAADCAPILLADGEAGVVACAHAGWRGALAGVAETALAAMESLGARSERIVAAIGPCIGPQSYEVGLEFVAAFEQQDPTYSSFFMPGASPDKRLFDLPGFVLSRLAALNISACEWVGADTFTDEERFFSNRRSFRRGETDYGRLLSAITLVGKR